MLKVKDSPYIKSIHYETAEEFIQAISYGGYLYETLGNNFIFRGHSTEKYMLLPTALRGYLSLENNILDKTDNPDTRALYKYLAETELIQINEEYRLLQDFFTNCDKNGLYVPYIHSLRTSFLPGVDGQTILLKDKWLPSSYWELAALAQHHGVKTRLLDWTQDINVALYFASRGVYYDKKELPNMLEAYKAHKEGREYPPKYNMELWALNENVVMAKPNQMPLRIIQPQYHNNDNLCAQKGLFTFWEVEKPDLINEKGLPNIKAKTDRRTLDEQLHDFLLNENVPNELYVYQITFPQDCAYEIYKYVDRKGYNASTIFPGYNGVAKYLEERRVIFK